MMNPRLLSMLAFVTVVGGAAVYTLGTNPDIGQPAVISDLVDAGITAQCSPRVASCTVELNAAGVNLALDAGFLDGGFLASWDGGLPVMAQLRTGVEICVDGGSTPVIVPRLIAKGLDPDQDDVRFLFSTCTLAACATAPALCQANNLGKATNVLIDTKPCRKRPVGAAAASCLRSLPDGGTYDWGDGNVMPAAEAAGAGCVPAACVVTDSRFDP